MTRLSHLLRGPDSGRISNSASTKMTLASATAKSVSSVPRGPSLDMRTAPSDGAAAWARKLGMAILPMMAA